MPEWLRGSTQDALHDCAHGFEPHCYYTEFLLFSLKKNNI